MSKNTKITVRKAARDIVEYCDKADAARGTFTLYELGNLVNELRRAFKESDNNKR